MDIKGGKEGEFLGPDQTSFYRVAHGVINENDDHNHNIGAQKYITYLFISADRRAYVPPRVRESADPFH